MEYEFCTLIELCLSSLLWLTDASRRVTCGPHLPRSQQWKGADQGERGCSSRPGDDGEDLQGHQGHQAQEQLPVLLVQSGGGAAKDRAVARRAPAENGRTDRRH